MVKLVVYDFDGVLTDNRVWVTQDGNESVACNRTDGWWIKEITRLGIEQVILSTEKNPVVGARAKKIGLESHQGLADKKSALVELCKNRDIKTSDVLYVGNDTNDLEAMSLVGYPACPADSHPDVLRIAKVKLPVNGGAGIVPHLFQWLRGHKENPPAQRKQPEKQGRHQGRVEKTLAESIRVKQELLQSREALALLEEMSLRASEALCAGNKIIFAGNGGSFADSMHLAAELVSKLMIDRAPLASIALGCANSNLTAIGNDYGYEFTFAREILALGKSGDVFIAISTSGNSRNVLEAVRVAKEMGLVVYGWSGQSGGQLAQEIPTIRVPSKDTARIQECHIAIGHIFCELVEEPFL